MHWTNSTPPFDRSGATSSLRDRIPSFLLMSGSNSVMVLARPKFAWNSKQVLVRRVQTSLGPALVSYPSLEPHYHLHPASARRAGPAMQPPDVTAIPWNPSSLLRMLSRPVLGWQNPARSLLFYDLPLYSRGNQNYLFPVPSVVFSSVILTLAPNIGRCSMYLHQFLSVLENVYDLLRYGSKVFLHLK